MEHVIQIVCVLCGYKGYIIVSGSLLRTFKCPKCDHYSASKVWGSEVL